jgi:hypothetical protein
MAINPTDIKLLESERMTDYEDGGGRRTSRIILDAVPGNIFPKVSRLDTVYGRVNFRKVYGQVATANLDVYAGSHAVITDPPDNNKIDVLLFDTKSEFDDRTAARDRVESYVIYGPESRMIFFGRQLMGQQAVQVYQRVEDPLPEIGNVLSLTNETGGVITTQQYVRIQEVSHEVRVFTDALNGASDFTRRVVSIAINAPLRYEFNGPESPSRYTSVIRASKVRGTTSADASRYFGITTLEEAASLGGLTVKVDSVYKAIIPTTNREVPLSTIQPSGFATYRTTSDSVAALRSIGAIANGTETNIGRSFKRSTCYVLGASGGRADDDGLGNLVITTSHASFMGAGTVGLTVATLDYDDGSYTATRTHTGTNTLWAQQTVPVSVSAFTFDIPVTLTSRGAVYSITLNPLPVERAITVDFRALGNWYTLSVRKGQSVTVLKGDDDAYGIGSIDYINGALVFTLGALPDVGTSIIVSWGVAATCTSRRINNNARYRMLLPEGSVARNTVSTTYKVSAVDRVATDNGAGLLMYLGSQVGTVNYTNGELAMDTHIDPSTNVSVAYSVGAPIVQTFVDPFRNVGDGTVTLTMANPPLKVNSIKLSWNTDVELYDPITRSIPRRRDPIIIAYDDGVGNIRLDDATKTIVGTVAYSTGAITFQPDVTTSIPYLNYGWVNISATRQRWQFTGFSYAPAACIAPPEFDVRAEYRSTDSETSKTAVGPPALRYTLTPGYSDKIATGSIKFTLKGLTYVDRNGSMYHTENLSTGTATLCGTVDYITGVVDLTTWGATTSMATTVQDCLSFYGNASNSQFTFRLAGSPIRSGSFYVQATALDGTLLTASASSNGYITGTKARGLFVYSVGLCFVEFGQMVNAAANVSQPWYRAENVVGGQIWEPLEVDPASLTYNAVVVTSLPLNADILGLDPVRLPSDGRVPIFKTGDVAVVHGKRTTVLPNPVTAGSTYPLGTAGSANNLAEAWVEDAVFKRVPTQRYAINKVTGTITIAADFNPTTEVFVLPLTVTYRLEDMVLLSDVQINGQLSLTASLSRDYLAGDYVSSAMLFGDMNARATLFRDQLTWTGAWSDLLQGSSATAEYNLIDYPVEVLNQNAVTERWRLSFTSTTAFQLIGENLGQIATGNITTDLTISNQLTGLPYFTLRAAGWGSGWVAGNQIRFNTKAAGAPIWLTRTILPGASLEGDSFMVQMRGDVDV